MLCDNVHIIRDLMWKWNDQNHRIHASQIHVSCFLFHTTIKPILSFLYPQISNHINPFFCRFRPFFSHRCLFGCSFWSSVGFLWVTDVIITMRIVIMEPDGNSTRLRLRTMAAAPLAMFWLPVRTDGGNEDASAIFIHVNSSVSA